MANRTLDHASIRVTDLEKSRAFYEGLLGLDRAPRPELGFPGVWYNLGGAQIHLIAHEKMMDGIDPTDPHMAIAVESLAAVKQDLEARGIKYIEFGGAQLWILDPDGNTVELCERR
jgi:glyoxylase I family protein